jgi:hypothetical protein
MSEPSLRETCLSLHQTFNSLAEQGACPRRDFPEPPSPAAVTLWLADSMASDGLLFEPFILWIASDAMRNRVQRSLAQAMSAWASLMHTHAGTLARFYAGQIPPGRDALEALVAICPDDDHYSCMTYRDFLASDYWKCIRALALERDGHECRNCKAKERLHVHHRTYEHRGREHEHLDDVTTLCEACHAKFHIKPSRSDSVVPGEAAARVATVSANVNGHLANCHDVEEWEDPF